MVSLFKKADRLSAFYEATQLAGFEEAEARRIFGSPPPGLKTPRLTPLPTSEAQALFLERFRRPRPGTRQGLGKMRKIAFSGAHSAMELF